MRPEVTRKLFATIAPWYAERPGGYTRIVRIGRRLGDAGEICYLELVKSVEQIEQERQARIAAEEAKDKALKGASKRKEKAPEASEAPADKPKRGARKGERESEIATPARKRTRRGVKTG
jgi:large subunit ribosomal protein L17